MVCGAASWCKLLALVNLRGCRNGMYAGIGMAGGSVIVAQAVCHVFGGSYHFK